MSNHEASGLAAVVAHLRHGLPGYLCLTLYLFICFTALKLFQLTLLNEAPNLPATFGTTLIQALIMGKFIVIGKAIKVGERRSPDLLLHRIIWKSIAMLVVLVVFKLIEELIRGLVHGHSVAQVIAEMAEKPWLQFVAPITILLLVLIPLIACEELDKALGKGTLKKLLLEGTNRT